ncbi:hypothetical protein TIFTF001_020928 [Ficus carica]|uniref:Uncharacterized protein n=1 Tax=Ficus carica TaxID=3494 RepID=A0AA88DE39_FICCA|nr:hypothetical protein TIFTF001_020928 [Ficus carica]
MTYNLPSNNVHVMAKDMSNVFEAMLKLLRNPHPSNEIGRMARQMGEEFGTKLKLFYEENMKD